MKTESILKNLFNKDYPNLTLNISRDNDYYLLHINEEFVAEYNPNLYRLVYNLLDGDTIVESIGGHNLNFYDVFENFIPQVKIKIYWKKRGDNDYSYIHRPSEPQPTVIYSGGTYIHSGY